MNIQEGSYINWLEDTIEHCYEQVEEIRADGSMLVYCDSEEGYRIVGLEQVTKVWD